jgi:hypothetical protein
MVGFGGIFKERHPIHSVCGNHDDMVVLEVMALGHSPSIQAFLLFEML